MARLAVVKSKDRRLNIYNALNLIKEDLEPVHRKKRILIKPNLTSTHNPYANTSAEVVEEIIDFVAQYGDKEFLIADGSGSAHIQGTTTSSVLENFGYYELERRHENVSVMSVEELSDFFTIPVMTVDGEEEVRVARLDVDYKISVGIPKTHDFAIATLGIKNMMGLVKQEDKELIHGHKGKSFEHSVKLIHHNLLSLARVTWPDLVVLDGYYCMEGDGPIRGSPVELDLSIASVDALKADGAGARIMGLEPEEVGYLHYAGESGLGDSSLEGISTMGIDPAKIKRESKFKMHSTYQTQKNWK